MSKILLELPDWFIWGAIAALYLHVIMYAVAAVFDYRLKRGKAKLTLLREIAVLCSKHT